MVRERPTYVVRSHADVRRVLESDQSCDKSPDDLESANSFRDHTVALEMEEAGGGDNMHERELINPHMQTML